MPPVTEIPEEDDDGDAENAPEIENPWSMNELSRELINEISEIDVDLTAKMVWMEARVARVSLLASTLAVWREQMLTSGYSPRAIEEMLPMIIDRVWPEEAQAAEIETTIMWPSHEEEGED